MEPSKALAWVKSQVSNKNLIKHMLATEAVMGTLAKRLGADSDLWRLAGLLHDIDYEVTLDNPSQHALVGAEMLKGEEIDQAVIQAVLAHNDHHPRQTDLDWALYATDPVTGLIVAAALIHPEKRLDAIDAEFVLKRFDEKSFARGARRESIDCCSFLGLTREEFVALALEAMQEIHLSLGL